MFGLNDNLSSIFGWVSIACWVIVYSPQIYENYSLQSGEGLSVLFIVVWLLGDLCNLVGAIVGHLLPTVIILAFYYSFCDLILLLQLYFYRWKQTRLPSTEREPLLNRNVRENIPTARLLTLYTGALLFVFAVGVIAWWIGDSTRRKERPPPPSGDIQWEIQVLGWTSALLYLGARAPQILKNSKTRCEGLSPALFFFAIFGNVTYTLSICAKSTDYKYILVNAGWLAGSALTVFLDAFVLCQIFYYRSADRVISLPAN